MLGLSKSTACDLIKLYWEVGVIVILSNDQIQGEREQWTSNPGVYLINYEETVFYHL